MLPPRWPVLCDPEQNVFQLHKMVKKMQPPCHVGVWIASSVMVLHCSPEQPSLLSVNNWTDVCWSRATDECPFKEGFTNVSHESWVQVISPNLIG